MLGQAGVATATTVFGQMDHRIGADQMMGEVVGKQIRAALVDPFVFEPHRSLVQRDHPCRFESGAIIVGRVPGLDELSNGPLADGTRRPGHHNREHRNTMPS